MYCKFIVKQPPRPILSTELFADLIGLGMRSYWCVVYTPHDYLWGINRNSLPLMGWENGRRFFIVSLIYSWLLLWSYILIVSGRNTNSQSLCIKRNECNSCISFTSSTTTPLDFVVYTFAQYCISRICHSSTIRTAEGDLKPVYTSANDKAWAPIMLISVTS